MTKTDPIAAGRAIAQAFNGPGGEGFQNADKLNLYTCGSCGHVMMTIDREPGTTPFTTTCPQEGCGGLAQSSAYRVPSACVQAGMAPTHEWTRPETIEGLSAGVIQHIANGGLILREIPKAPPSDEITIEYEVTETATYRKSLTVTAEVAADPELLADAMSQDWMQHGDTQEHFIEVTERDYARVTD